VATGASSLHHPSPSSDKHFIWRCCSPSSPWRQTRHGDPGSRTAWHLDHSEAVQPQGGGLGSLGGQTSTLRGLLPMSWQDSMGMCLVRDCMSAHHTSRRLIAIPSGTHSAPGSPQAPQEDVTNTTCRVWTMGAVNLKRNCVGLTSVLPACRLMRSA